MKGVSHAAVGLAFGVTAAVIAHKTGGTLFGVPVNPIALVLTSAAGGLKLDADMENNSQRKGYGLLWNLAQKTPLIKKLFGHRGLATHSYYVSLAVFYIGSSLTVGQANMITQIVASLIIGTAVGMFSHSYIDSFNGKGIPGLAPIPYRVNLMSITSDTAEEAVFIPIFLLAMIANIVLIAMGVTL